MNSDSANALLLKLESAASALVSAPGIESLLASLDGLPAAISQVPALVQDPNLLPPEERRLQFSIRDCLVHLQRALIYADSRLRHEHESLRVQLVELSTQIQWAERSRESA